MLQPRHRYWKSSLSFLPPLSIFRVSVPEGWPRHFPLVNIALSRAKGLLRWLSGKESTCQCRRHRFNPWVRKIPWRRKRQPTPGFLPGKPHGQRGLADYRPWGRERVGHDLQQHASLTNLGLHMRWNLFALPGLTETSSGEKIRTVCLALPQGWVNRQLGLGFSKLVPVFCE